MLYMGSRGVAVVRALVSHQCSPGCWFSLCSEGFSPGSPVFLPMADAAPSLNIVNLWCYYGSVTKQLVYLNNIFYHELDLVHKARLISNFPVLFLIVF